MKKFELKPKNLTEELFCESVYEWFRNQSKDYNLMRVLTTAFESENTKAGEGFPKAANDTKKQE